MLLLGIVVLAFAFRAYRIDSLPAGLWWDEAFSGLRVEQIIADPSYRPVFVGGRAQGATALWYTMAPFVAALGTTAAALRATAVLAGTLGTLSTYLLGRELFGRRVGLVAAAIIAVLTWHVNFSRIAFNAIWSATLDALAAYLLIRALRTRRLFDFALGGLALGLAANMYYTTRLLPIVLGVYLLHRLALERRAFLERALPGLAVFAAVALLAVAPLIQFGIANPGEFASRLTEASIFKEVQATGGIAPIVSNLREHVLMFNYAGDDNGRHNLPGAPMLDQVVGAAFVLGLALCIRGARKPRHSLLLAWVIVMLAGGVFSLSFEAPQALRTIDETTAVALLASLPIVGLWETFEALPIGRIRLRLPASFAPTLASCLAAAILAVVAGLGYQRYFVQQAGDFAVWAAFSTAETITADRVNALPPDYQVYLDETMLDHPTLQYLTHRPTDFQRFEESASLPFRDPAGAAVYLKPEMENAVAEIQRLYPGAEVETVRNRADGPPLLYAVTVPPAEVTSLQGAVASYYRGGDFDSPASGTDLVGALDFHYSAAPPLPYPFGVEVQGTLAVPEYGKYTFSLAAPDGAELALDETPLLQTGQPASGGSATLARGIHTIRLRAVLAGPASVTVFWSGRGGPDSPAPLASALFSPNVPSTGLLGAYYPNATFSGPPSLEQIDPELAIRFHILPLPRPYSVEWRGKLVAPKEGLYRFGVAASSDAQIFVDGEPVATNAGAGRDIADGQPIRLAVGLHDVRVRFVDSADFSFVRAYWSPPGEVRKLLPSAYLLPPRGAYPNPATLVPETPVPPPTGWSDGSALPQAGLRQAAVLGKDAQLRDPRGVAVDADGNVYVADTGNARVVKLSPVGEVLATWGQKGTGEGEFQEPVAVAVEPAGSILVLDAAEGYIQRFSPEGAFLARFGGPAIRPYHPRGLAVEAGGDVAVADTGGSQVDLLDPDGKLIAKLGQRGSGAGQIVEPTDVIRLPDGGFVVADSANDRALRLDADFKLVAEWALPPNESVLGPHLAYDGTAIYVSDPAHGRVIRFSPLGEALDQVGGTGDLRSPVGLATDGAGRLYVADAKAGVIAVYEP
ncbi:MAG TPA: PA14 domain-containing protein [Solirubrobacterales bacterium]